MASSVEFKWNERNVGLIRQRFTAGMFRLAGEVATQARDRAPYKTTALRGSIRITTDAAGNSTATSGADNLWVIAGGQTKTGGGGLVAYARIHELGGWTGRNYATYIKPKHYLENSFVNVMNSGIARFFKGVA